jgi:flagellar hook-basal body complex protein FliE
MRQIQEQEMKMKEVEEIKEIIEESKKDLLHQKSHVEHQIKMLERKQQDDKLKDVMIRMQEINYSITLIQNNLNIVWKRAQQVQEEINEVLNAPYPKLE